MNKFDLEERLIEFAALIVQITESMPQSRAANHLGGQLLRSGTSAALNYGEALGGESRNDFVHKIKVSLKELRENMICLKIIERTNLYSEESTIRLALRENNELISIFVKSCLTAQRNSLRLK
jgi:four helix bundle protein